jgi:membrane protease YdiL (CAAX protease family)
MLLMMYTVAFALLIPAALSGLPMEPFLLGVVLLAQLLPAVLVTGAVGGRPAVRELFGRVFRWRVHPRWYLLALLGLPAASLLGAAVVLGPGVVGDVLTDPHYLVAYLGTLIALPLVNMWEETAWMGIVQARLTARHGLLLGAAITGPLFGLVHLPLQIGKPAGQFVTNMLILMVLAVALRIVIGWLYDRTGASILLVAVLHATFNSTNNNMGLVADAAHGVGSVRTTLVSNMTWAVLVAWALVVVVTLVRSRRHAAQLESVRR